MEVFNSLLTGNQFEKLIDLLLWLIMQICSVPSLNPLSVDTLWQAGKSVTCRLLVYTLLGVSYTVANR